MQTKKLQLVNSLIKEAQNADTLDGKHAEEFALASDVEQLQTKMGDASVSEQIVTALDGYVKLDPNDTAVEGTAALVNAGTFNGLTYDAVKSDIQSSITYADVGAAAASHTHDYVPKTAFSLSGTTLTITTA